MVKNTHTHICRSFWLWKPFRPVHLLMAGERSFSADLAERGESGCALFQRRSRALSSSKPPERVGVGRAAPGGGQWRHSSPRGVWLHLPHLSPPRWHGQHHVHQTGILLSEKGMTVTVMKAIIKTTSVTTTTMMMTMIMIVYNACHPFFLIRVSWKLFPSLSFPRQAFIPLNVDVVAVVPVLSVGLVCYVVNHQHHLTEATVKEGEGKGRKEGTSFSH